MLLGIFLGIGGVLECDRRGNIGLLEYITKYRRVLWFNWGFRVTINLMFVFRKFYFNYMINVIFLKSFVETYRKFWYQDLSNPE